MRDLEWIKRKAKNYNLEAEYINNDSLKVYSKKFDFDSWLIIETKEEMELWHQSKRCGIKNVSYHLQKTVPKCKKIWMLQRIKSHNNHVAFGRYKVNLVDKLLSKEAPRLKIS